MAQAAPVPAASQLARKIQVDAVSGAPADITRRSDELKPRYVSMIEVAKSLKICGDFCRWAADFGATQASAQRAALQRTTDMLAEANRLLNEMPSTMTPSHGVTEGRIVPTSPSRQASMNAEGRALAEVPVRTSPDPATTTSEAGVRLPRRKFASRGKLTKEELKQKYLANRGRWSQEVGSTSNAQVTSNQNHNLTPIFTNEQSRLRWRANASGPANALSRE